MVLLQKWPFFHFFFSQYRQGKFVLQYSRKKNTLLSYENTKLKKSTNWNISKAVNPRFWSKNGRFSNFFFLGNIGQENVFYDILERKNVLLGYKNKKFKKSKNWHFSKGVKTHAFGPKMAFFPTFFFRQYRPGKCLLRYSRTKTRLSRL